MAKWFNLKGERYEPCQRADAEDAAKRLRSTGLYKMVQVFSIKELCGFPGNRSLEVVGYVIKAKRHPYSVKEAV